MRKIQITCTAVLSAFLASPAQAHVDLISPPARLGGEAGGGQLKLKPCGQTTNKRGDKVTTFTPGQKVDIKIKEYVDHPGYLAVAFDPDGDDSFPFPRANMDKVNANTDDPKALFPVDGTTILGLRTDKDKNCATENADKTCTISITIPNMTCQNCTLQVTQFMYDKLGDNADNEYYYQCADIKVEGPVGGGGGAGGTGGAAGGSAGAASGGGGAGGALGGSGGSPGSTAGATSGGMSTTAGTNPGTAGTTPTAGSATAGSTSNPGGATSSDDGGCGIAHPARGGASALAALGLLLGLVRRRRSR